MPFDRFENFIQGQRSADTAWRANQERQFLGWRRRDGTEFRFDGSRWRKLLRLEEDEPLVRWLRFGMRHRLNG